MTYLFVIDTDSYAGGFERELCAFITGVVSDFGVGEKEAKIFAEECEEDVIGELEFRNDEPCIIYPTKGIFNDGLGNEYRDEEWGEPYILENYKKEAENHPHLKDGVPERFPAYRSVAILFYDKPSDDSLKLMKERAERFSQTKFSEFQETFKITGFRLILEETISKEIEI